MKKFFLTCIALFVIQIALAETLSLATWNRNELIDDIVENYPPLRLAYNIGLTVPKIQIYRLQELELGRDDWKSLALFYGVSIILVSSALAVTLFPVSIYNFKRHKTVELSALSKFRKNEVPSSTVIGVSLLIVGCFLFFTMAGTPVSLHPIIRKLPPQVLGWPSMMTFAAIAFTCIYLFGTVFWMCASYSFLIWWRKRSIN